MIWHILTSDESIGQRSLEAGVDSIHLVDHVTDLEIAEAGLLLL